MTDELVLKKVEQLMDDLSYHFRVVSVNRLSELESELAAKANEGCFDAEFYQERLTSFAFHPPQRLSGAKSIIIIAIRQPMVVVIFEWNGKDHSVRIPPAYDVIAEAETQHRLEEILQPEGYTVAPATLPLKLLAARSGLVEYAKNNICYVPGMGSFHRLVAFYTDLPCHEEHWGRPALLERCSTCEACVVKCPTHAISTDRFLLRAERCLTFHNEHAKEFPLYVDRSWHHCLLGCLLCQRFCPENKKFLDWSEERGRFSEEETTLILRGVPLDKVPASTRQKLERLSLFEDYTLLARNLSLVLETDYVSILELNANGA